MKLDYKCEDCGCEVIQGEYAVYGVCSECYHKNKTMKTVNDDTVKEETEKLKYDLETVSICRDNAIKAIERLKQENAKLKAALRELIPLAEDGVKWSEKHAMSHQEFYIDDKEAIDNAKQLLE